MPAKHKPITIYPDDQTVQEWEALRAYYQAKAGPQVKVNDGYIGRELIRQKASDVRNQQTKSLTLARLYELMERMYADIKALREGG